MDIIVCIDKNNGIGKDGGLLFRIPEDMAYFRRMTVKRWNHCQGAGRWRTAAT